MKKEESDRSVSWPCDQELFITIKTWDSTSCFTGFYLQNVFLKGTVSVILSDPPCKDGKARYPWKLCRFSDSTSVYISVNFQLLLISNKYASYFCRETANKNRQYYCTSCTIHKKLNIMCEYSLSPRYLLYCRDPGSRRINYIHRILIVNRYMYSVHCTTIKLIMILQFALTCGVTLISELIFRYTIIW